MRVVDRKTFLSLPPGTVYQEYQHCNCNEGLWVKTRNCEGDNDWFYIGLTGTWIADCRDDVSQVDGFFESEESGTEIKTTFEAQARDGSFDDD